MMVPEMVSEFDPTHFFCWSKRPFKFEYTASKLFHQELTDHAGDLDRSHAISTAVNVEDVEVSSIVPPIRLNPRAR